MLSTLRRSPVIGARLGNRQAIQLRCYNKKRVNFDIGEEIHNKEFKKEKEISKLQAQIDNLIKEGAQRDKEGAQRESKLIKEGAQQDKLIKERAQRVTKLIKEGAQRETKLMASIKRLEEEKAGASGPKPESIDWSKAEIKIKSCEFQEPFLERERSIEVFETYKNEFFSGTKEGTLCWTEEKDVNQRKSRLLTTVGVPGTGKTTFVKNMAAKVTKEGFLAVFVSYNEDSQPIDLTNDPKMNTTRFAAQLLSCNGLESEYAKANAPKVNTIIKRLVELNPGCKGIIIFIDELIQIARDAKAVKRVQSLNSKLMGIQDSSKKDFGKGVMFVFTALTDDFSENLMPGSGRPISKIPLCNLNWENAEAAIPAERMDIIKKSKLLYQIFLSCAGHPGLLASLGGMKSAHLRKVKSDVAGSSVRMELISKLCSTAKLKNIDAVLDKTALRWFGSNIQGTEISEMEQAGIIQKIGSPQNPRRFLVPLLFYRWDPRGNVCNVLLKNHLEHLYSADASLRTYHEKDMEGVMMHFECVRKVALGNNTRVRLGYFFKGALICEKLRRIEIQIKFKKKAKILVREVDKLNDDDVLRLLKDGYTVTSRNPTELGAERLVPFFRTDGSLYVALMQDKFVQKDVTSWAVAKKNLDQSSAVKHLTENNVDYFYVFNTTIDQHTVQKETLKGCVIFTETGLMDYTIKLGPLRLHTESR